MGIGVDGYTLRARITPVYLAISPVIMLLAALLPASLNLTFSGASAIVLVPLAVLASQVGADFGKRLELSLWRSWGGAPTTRWLRHSNAEYNPGARNRVHAKLRSLGLAVPTSDEESHDPLAADSEYESAVVELIRLTRDAKEFPRVYEGLTEYGFRRNLLGLKPLGLATSAVAFVVCGFALRAAWAPDGPPGMTVAAMLVSGGLLATWLLWVNGDGVRLAADRYARSLLEGALNVGQP